MGLLVVAGEPGVGKTEGFLTLSSEEVVLINVDSKPFKRAYMDDGGKELLIINLGGSVKKDDKGNRLPPPPPEEFLEAFQEALEQAIATNRKYIILDSFTETLTRVEAGCVANFEGFNVWSNYNDTLFTMIDRANYEEALFIVTAHTVEKDGKQIIKCKADFEKVGGIIGKAPIVVYAYSEPNPSGLGVQVSYSIKTNGINPARSPKGVYDDTFYNMIVPIEKGYNVFLPQAEEYFKD